MCACQHMGVLCMYACTYVCGWSYLRVLVSGVAEATSVGAALSAALLRQKYTVIGLDQTAFQRSFPNDPRKEHPVLLEESASRSFHFLNDWIAGDKHSTELAVQKIVALSKQSLVGLANCCSIAVPYMPATDDLHQRCEHFEQVVRVNLVGIFLLTEMVSTAIRMTDDAPMHPPKTLSRRLGAARRL